MGDDIEQSADFRLKAMALLQHSKTPFDERATRTGGRLSGHPAQSPGADMSSRSPVIKVQSGRRM
jgi:hypothetical protein